MTWRNCWQNGSITITGNVLIALTTVKLRWNATLNLLRKHHTLMPFMQTISPMKSIYRNRITSLNLDWENWNDVYESYKCQRQWYKTVTVKHRGVDTNEWARAVWREGVMYGSVSSRGGKFSPADSTRSFWQRWRTCGGVVLADRYMPSKQCGTRKMAALRHWTYPRLADKPGTRSVTLESWSELSVSINTVLASRLRMSMPEDL